ncbi:MAG: GMP/IMP nucleotidase [Methylococcales bacterium]|nr:GMP/IMP nucleotidase [Methylococcales bacterium]MCK5925764.1 GMP/IMP nucleotidase [Methylococcales bacterium]
MQNWKQCDTILLDMDGTLLDLRFDNYFWCELVPLKYAEKNKITRAEAKKVLVPLFKQMEGRIEWYCLDYWTQTLDLNIAELKAVVADQISILPYVMDFLTTLQHSQKQVVLVTNAHQDSLRLKMKKTGLQSFFDAIICSHDFGVAKEHPLFWKAFHQKIQFNKSTTLMIDDSLAVLKAAKQFGVGQLIAISQPDSQQPPKTIEGYCTIKNFEALL